MKVGYPRIISLIKIPAFIKVAFAPDLLHNKKAESGKA